MLVFSLAAWTVAFLNILVCLYNSYKYRSMVMCAGKKSVYTIINMILFMNVPIIYMYIQVHSK